MMNLKLETVSHAIIGMNSQLNSVQRRQHHRLRSCYLSGLNRLSEYIRVQVALSLQHSSLGFSLPLFYIRVPA